MIQKSLFATYFRLRDFQRKSSDYPTTLKLHVDEIITSVLELIKLKKQKNKTAVDQSCSAPKQQLLKLFWRRAKIRKRWLKRQLITVQNELRPTVGVR